MKPLVAVGVLAALVLIFLPWAHFSSEDQGINYSRYRKQYTHNLKNPLLERYRKLSCEPSKEVAVLEEKQEDLL